MAYPMPTKASLKPSPDIANAVFIPQVYQPTSACPVLSIHAEPISQGLLEVVSQAVIMHISVHRHLKS